MKKALIAVVAVFVAWTVLDYVIHQLILASTYAATANLWRPMEEMRMGLLSVVTLISSFVFVFIYFCFFAERGIGVGVKYGLLFGFGSGVSMAYGCFAVMPIPYHMALTWFLGTMVETTVAGAIVGAIVCGKSDSGGAEAGKAE